jgi:hypothetical protein
MVLNKSTVRALLLSLCLPVAEIMWALLPSIGLHVVCRRLCKCTQLHAVFRDRSVRPSSITRRLTLFCFKILLDGTRRLWRTPTNVAPDVLRRLCVAGFTWVALRPSVGVPLLLAAALSIGAAVYWKRYVLFISNVCQDKCKTMAKILLVA